MSRAIFRCSPVMNWASTRGKARVFCSEYRVAGFGARLEDARRADDGGPLGPYEERIRQYLAGESSFPADVLVAVHVCTDIGSQGMIYSPERVKGVHAIYSDHSFLVRGLWFHVYVGKDIPTAMREICCVNSPKKVIFMRSCEKEFAEITKGHFCNPPRRERLPARKRAPDSGLRTDLPPK